MSGHSIKDCVPFKDEVQKLIQLGVLSFDVEEMVINETSKENIATSIAIFDSYIDEKKQIIECPAQS